MRWGALCAADVRDDEQGGHKGRPYGWIDGRMRLYMTGRGFRWPVWASMAETKMTKADGIQPSSFTFHHLLEEQARSAVNDETSPFRSLRRLGGLRTAWWLLAAFVRL